MSEAPELLSLSRRTRRRAVAVVAVFIAINLVTFLLADQSDPDPEVGESAPTTASKSANADGFLAYRTLLERNGIEVIDDASTRASLPRKATVISFGRSVFSRNDLIDVASDGGRLIVLGDAALAEFTTGSRTTEVADSRLRVMDSDVTELRGVTELDAPITTVFWGGQTPFTPLIMGDPGFVISATRPQEQGTIVIVSDPALLSNSYLDQADNAAFGLAIVGAGPVYFDERPPLTPTSAGSTPEPTNPLPSEWTWTMALLATAALVWMAGAGRRFGPPEPISRQLDPSRKEFVESVAATLARTGHTGAAAAPLRLHARRLVIKQSGLPENSSDQQIREAGKKLGLTDQQVATFTSTSTDENNAVMAGRLVAALSRGKVTGN